MTSHQSRYLASLEGVASTANVLNLNKIYEIQGTKEQYHSNPFFKNNILNRSIIVKHKLRESEIEDFPELRHACTKLIIPIDFTDLKKGVFYLFVGQKKFEKILSEKLNRSLTNLERDFSLLYDLDSIPTLDPFILSQYVKSKNFDISDCYFQLYSKNIEVNTYILDQILCLDRLVSNGYYDEKISKSLAVKISDKPERFCNEVSRSSLYYKKYMLSWKYVIYYRWVIRDYLPKILKLFSDLANIKPQGTPNMGLNISAIKMNTLRNIYLATHDINIFMKQYDIAYDKLINEDSPRLIIEFIMKSPEIFNQLTERIGSLEQILNFWSVKFPKGARPLMTYDELLELLLEFDFILGS